MTTPTQPADLLATDLRRICGHDSRSVDGCVTCEAADRIESLAAHRGEVVPYGYVMRCDSYRRQPEFYDTKPGFVPPISTLVPVYIHPPQAQAVAGDTTNALNCVDSTDRLPSGYRVEQHASGNWFYAVSDHASADYWPERSRAAHEAWLHRERQLLRDLHAAILRNGRAALEAK